MKKIYCSTCKFCSSIQDLCKVSCDADCVLRERPSYVKYVKDEEKRLSKINPVTGEENRSCPVINQYGDGMMHYPIIDKTPSHYVLCCVRNKNFDCKHYIKTAVPFYFKIFHCPYCNGKLDIIGSRYSCNSGLNSYHTGADMELSCPDCSSKVYYNKDFSSIVDFDFENNIDYYNRYGYGENKKLEQAERNQHLVNARVKKKLGLITNDEFQRVLSKNGCYADEYDEIVCSRPWWKFWE